MAFGPSADRLPAEKPKPLGLDTSRLDTHEQGRVLPYVAGIFRIGGTFLGEPWDERVLAHDAAESKFRDATTFPQNPEALRPIEQKALRRWERDLSADDRAVFKRIAGDLLIEQGYAADSSW